MPSRCASTTRAMATKAMSEPMSALPRHCAAVGQAWPCQRAYASITTPASTKRVPFMSSGGRLCTATLIAK
ncbi:hypothetical protein D9M68_846650 [compost metagenome]